MRTRLLNASFLLLSMVTAVALVFLLEAVRRPGAPGAIPTVSGRSNVPVRQERGARVAAVVDAQTVRLESGASVRLIGIVPPTEPAFLAAAAADVLRALVVGQTLVMEADGSDQADDGALRRHLFLSNGTSVQAELLRGGYVRVDEGSAGRYRQPLLDAEREARQARLGLWNYLPTPTPVVISTYTLPTLVAGAPPAASGTPTAMRCDPALADALDAVEVADIEGQRQSKATVIFQVGATEGNDAEGAILYALNPPGNRFRVVIPPPLRQEYLAQFGEPPETVYRDRCISVSGRVDLIARYTEITVANIAHILIWR